MDWSYERKPRALVNQLLRATICRDISCIKKLERVQTMWRHEAEGMVGIWQGCWGLDFFNLRRSSPIWPPQNLESVQYGYCSVEVAGKSLAWIQKRAWSKAAHSFVQRWAALFQQMKFSQSVYIQETSGRVYGRGLMKRWTVVRLVEGMCYIRVYLLLYIH